MLVLKFWSDAHREAPSDVFVYHPFDFEAKYSRALRFTHPNGIPAAFVGIPALIRM